MPLKRISFSFATTPISDKAICDNELSGNAFKVLCLLVLKDDPWGTSKEFLREYMLGGQHALNSAIRDLERGAYLKRIRYRNPQNNLFAGSYWLFSQIPGTIDYEDAYDIIRRRGFIPYTEGI